MSASNDEASHGAASLGVLFTGYMHKKNPGSWRGNWQKRFLVLTYESFYWFKREDNYELFGEERGHIALSELASFIPSNNNTVLELTDRKGQTRYFKPIEAGNVEQIDEWLSALSIAHKQYRTAKNTEERNNRNKVPRPFSYG